jgi:hypothetical protein
LQQVDRLVVAMGVGLKRVDPRLTDTHVILKLCETVKIAMIEKLGVSALVFPETAIAAIFTFSQLSFDIA